MRSILQHSAVVLTLFALAGVPMIVAPVSADGLDDTTFRDKLKGMETVPWVAPQHLGRRLEPSLPKPEAELATARSQFRDPAAIEVFAKAAPGIVYVTDGETGHGSGFFVREDGWIVTNNHVVDGMPFSAERGGQVARIVYGNLDKDGAMQVVPGYLEAVVYKRDETRDLALLKLTKLPAGVRRVPFIKRAEKTPSAGTSCYAIGHPSSGVLWTLRVGVISGHGRHPHDHIVPGLLLGVDPQVTREVQAALKDQPFRRTTLSTCGVNPGDSGGPLLDEEGKLIAVTYAVPADVGDRSFSYHVELQEVEEFLEDWPKQPRPTPPSSIPQARNIATADLDEDQIDETLVFSVDEESGPKGIWIDVDQDSAGSPSKKKLLNRLSTFDPVTDWDTEFAMVFQPNKTIFFDTDNDNRMDLIIMPRNERKSIQMTLKNDRWTVTTATEIFPAKPFQSAEMNERWRTFAKLFE